MSATPITPAPFRGLASFGSSELDTLLFFGRDRECEVVAANLLASPLSVLYGSTGVGKSSLLCAGVVPRLRLASPVVLAFDEWAQPPVDGLVRSLRLEAERVAGIELPGRSTMPGLADALDEAAGLAGGEVHVLLDQFEEYFAYRDQCDPDGAFVRQLGEALARPGSPATFLLAVRDDALYLLDRLTPAIPGVLSNRLRLGRLGHAAGEIAITGPIERVNELGGLHVEVEPELVDEVLSNVTSRSAGSGGGRNGEAGIEAPYLQLVMARLWEAERAGGSSVLRAETLRSLGGAGTIATGHLEAALGSFTSTQADIAAAVLGQLVTPSGTKVAHGLADLASYAGSPAGETRQVLESLVGERILRPLAPLPGAADQRYEIFHDVLAEPIAGWRTRHAAERGFLAEREQAARRHRRLSVGLAVALVAVAALAALTVFAFSQRGEAREQARLAEAGKLAASATAVVREDPELAMLLGLEAAVLAPTDDVEAALREALIAARVRTVIGGRGDDAVRTALLAPDGASVVVLRKAGRLELIDSMTGNTIRELAAAGVVSVALDATGARAALGRADGRVEVIVLDSGQTEELGMVAGVRRVAFAADGSLLAVGRSGAVLWRDGASRQLAVEGAPITADARDGVVAAAAGRRVMVQGAGGRVVSFDGGARVRTIAVLPGGRAVVTGGGDGTARIWNVTTGLLVRELTGHRSPILALATTGSLLATGGADGTVRVWDTVQGRLTAVIGEHGNLVRSVTFDPTGLRLATTSDDRLARIWDVETGRLLAELSGHRDSVRTAAFGGDVVLTASTDGTARIWDPRSDPTLALLARFDAPIVSLSALAQARLLIGRADGVAVLVSSTGESLADLRHGDSLVAAAASTDGRVLVTVGAGAVRLWRGEDVTVPVAELTTPGEPRAVAVSGDGSLAAVAMPDTVWILRDGRLATEIETEGAAGIAIAPDAGQVATAHDDGRVRLWDLTGRLEARLEGHRDGVTAVSYSSDGSRLVSTSLDHDARVWERGGGPAIAVLRGHFARVAGASFSADGRWIVTAGPASGALWEVATGRLVSYLRGHEGPLSAALVTPAGPTIVTGGADGTVRGYVCEICRGLDGLRELATLRLAATGRTLTPEERERYLGEQP